MKRATLICFVFLLLLSFDVRAEKIHENLIIKSAESFLLFQGNLNFPNSTDTSVYINIPLKEYTFIYVAQIIITFVILILAFFIIILTPLILFYCWISNYLSYQKYHTFIYGLKNTSKKLPKHLISEYKHIFSSMFANGFGILTWILSSYIYISFSYNKLSDGLLDYLKFPFKLIYGVANENITPIQDIIPLEVWASMLLIVGISIIHFYLGRFIGKTIIDSNYKTFPFHINKPEVEISY